MKIPVTPSHILAAGCAAIKKGVNYLKYRAAALQSLERGIESLSQDLCLNRIIFVRLDRINHYLAESGRSGEPPGGTAFFSDKFVRKGNWDAGIKPLIPDYYNQEHKRAVSFRSTFQVFRDGLPFRECDEYKKKLRGESGYVRASAGELEEKYKNLLMLFDSIKNNGYKSQRELGKNRLKWPNEIKVVIDRNGRLIKISAGGNHRLAMAHILQVDYVPVYIQWVHYDWVLKCHRKHGRHPLYSIKKELALLNCKLAGKDRQTHDKDQE